MVDSLVHKVRVERLKVFYMKWIYSNGDETLEEHKKLVVPIRDWLTNEAIKKAEKDWDKN